MPKRVLGPRSEKVTRDHRTFHSEELNNFCSSPDVAIRAILIKQDGWGIEDA